MQKPHELFPFSCAKCFNQLDFLFLKNTRPVRVASSSLVRNRRAHATSIRRVSHAHHQAVRLKPVNELRHVRLHTTQTPRQLTQRKHLARLH